MVILETWLQKNNLQRRDFREVITETQLL